MLENISEIPVVFITGPSGVGKSTLLRQTLNFKWHNDLTVKIPKKYTTRELRADEESLELIKLGEEEYAESGSQFLVSYEDYGKKYGLEAEAFKKPDRSKIYIQALPTSMALAAKKKLQAETGPWRVYICKLEQEPEEIVKRLVARGDKITLRQILNRAKGANISKNSSLKVDFIFKTNKESRLLVEELSETLFGKALA